MQNKQKIIVFSNISDNLAKKLNANYQVVYVSPQKNLQDFNAQIADADGLIGAGCYLSEEHLKHAKQLKIISSISAGYDNYDIKYLKAKNILLSHTPHVLTETTADLAFALLMSTARRIPELCVWTKSGQWTKKVRTQNFGQDVFGKTLGIIGLGNIGSAIARRGFHGFNMNILYHSRSEKPDLAQPLNATYCSLDTLLQESDFVVSAVNLNSESHALIGKKELEKMQKHSIFINISRGSVVDENALIEILKQKKIFGAGLDVYQKEPLSNSELFNLDNVVTLPHLGSATQETDRKMEELAYQNLTDVLNGKNCRYLVIA